MGTLPSGSPGKVNEHLIEKGEKWEAGMRREFLSLLNPLLLHCLHKSTDGKTEAE